MPHYMVDVGLAVAVKIEAQHEEEAREKAEALVLERYDVSEVEYVDILEELDEEDVA